MSTRLDSIVNISITRQSTAVAEASFGIPLVVGDSGVLPEVDTVVLTFDAELVVLNSIAYDYNGVAATPVVFGVDNDTTMGALASAIQAETEVATAVASDVGAVGYDNTITITGNADPARVIVANVIVTLGASQPVVTAVRVAHTRTRYYANLTAVAVDFAATDLEYLAASALFSQPVPPPLVGIGAWRAGDASITAALNAIQTADSSWYALILTTRGQADVVLAATWTESQVKLFGTASANAVILTAGTTDIAAVLSAASRERTFVMYNSLADGSVADPWPEAAWFGKMLAKDPGSATWAFKTLSGIVAEVVTDTELGFALSKEYNMYLNIANVNITYTGDDGSGNNSGGVVASGEYIDVIRGTDWLKSLMQTNVYSKLVNLDKVAFTNVGIAVITTEMRKTLEKGIDNGFLAVNTDPDTYDGRRYEIVAPDVADVSFNDRANRKLSDVTFQAQLAGAIHEVRSIDGVLSV